MTDRPRRLVSIDVFRGMTVMGMILVNNPGDWGHVYAPLLHAAWHGWTPTDLVFPFFLFIVGTAIVLALGRRVEAGAPRGQLVSKIVRRSAVLFALGLFLSGYPFGLFGSRTFERLLETWRIPGVLQRIAICYLVVSLMFLFLSRRTLKLCAVVFLVGYWALMTLVPVPGVGAPDLDSKGDHLAGYIDRAVFGNHLWISAKVYDPEGLLSTVPALATTLFGVFAGLLLASGRTLEQKVLRLFVQGSLLVVLGYVWSGVLPLNKALWTSSYAVFTAGQAMCALALCVWFFDGEGGTSSGRASPSRQRLARPFVLYGINAITVFVGSGVLARTLAGLKFGEPERSLQKHLYSTVFEPLLPPHAASLSYAIAWILGWYAVLWWMDRRGLVIKV